MNNYNYSDENDLDRALTDNPRSGGRRPARRERPIGHTTVRALADAVSKVSSRLPVEGQETDDIVDDRKVLDECAGLLLRLANKYSRTDITSAISIQLVVLDDPPQR